MVDDNGESDLSMGPKALHPIYFSTKKPLLARILSGSTNCAW